MLQIITFELTRLYYTYYKIDCVHILLIFFLMDAIEKLNTVSVLLTLIKIIFLISL